MILIHRWMLFKLVGTLVYKPMLKEVEGSRHFLRERKRKPFERCGGKSSGLTTARPQMGVGPCCVRVHMYICRYRYICMYICTHRYTRINSMYTYINIFDRAVESI